MIGYFIKSGDENVSEIFTPYVWKENGFENIFKTIIGEKDYGKDLKLLLIKYYVIGKFEINAPEQPKASNYSTNNKDIAVDVTVMPKDFHDRNDKERRTFIVNSTLSAIDLVRARLSKKKLDIDFDQLISDVEKAGKSFIGQ
jgi:cellulose biosynthesis protein BcsQ